MTVMNHPVSPKPQNKLPTLLEEFNQAQELCMKLLKTKHYQKMGPDGVFAITQKAISKGINPIEALNGGMYYVQGKVEMSAITMADLIRRKGHSITLGKESNDTICVLHGKRKDNGDTWKVSFSIEDAKRAGIYKSGGPWTKYPDTMCYSRALSKLARQLFPDVIGNSYVEGEISDAPPLFDQPNSGGNEKNDLSCPTPCQENSKIFEEISSEDIVLEEDDCSASEQLNELVEKLPEERRNNFLSFVQNRFKVEKLEELAPEDAIHLISQLQRLSEKEKIA
jgi:hypothetical protein